MARELHWRRYPTDFMGTCFARFWSAEGQEDVAPLHLWGDRLGRNAAPGDHKPGEDVVLVVRGDLLRAYPGTDIAAVHGRIEENEFHPTPLADAPDLRPARRMFADRLPPDITFVGLAISKKELKADDVAGGRWYLALTQTVEEPRFGLDDDRKLLQSPATTACPGRTWRAWLRAAI
jgi:hypothetical protein